jgi:hypothetical protein
VFEENLITTYFKNSTLINVVKSFCTAQSGNTNVYAFETAVEVTV